MVDPVVEEENASVPEAQGRVLVGEASQAVTDKGELVVLASQPPDDRPVAGIDLGHFAEGPRGDEIVAVVVDVDGVPVDPVQHRALEADGRVGDREVVHVVPVEDDLTGRRDAADDVRGDERVFETAVAGEVDVVVLVAHEDLPTVGEKEELVVVEDDFILAAGDLRDLMKVDDVPEEVDLGVIPSPVPLHDDIGEDRPLPGKLDQELDPRFSQQRVPGDVSLVIEGDDVSAVGGHDEVLGDEHVPFGGIRRRNRKIDVDRLRDRAGLENQGFGDNAVAGGVVENGLYPVGRVRRKAEDRQDEPLGLDGKQRRTLPVVGVPPRVIAVDARILDGRRNDSRAPDRDDGADRAVRILGDGVIDQLDRCVGVAPLR